MEGRGVSATSVLRIATASQRGAGVPSLLARRHTRATHSRRSRPHPYPLTCMPPRDTPVTRATPLQCNTRGNRAVPCSQNHTRTRSTAHRIDPPPQNEPARNVGSDGWLGGCARARMHWHRMMATDGITRAPAPVRAAEPRQGDVMREKPSRAEPSRAEPRPVDNECARNANTTPIAPTLSRSQRARAERVQTRYDPHERYAGVRWCHQQVGALMDLTILSTYRRRKTAGSRALRS